MMAEKLVAVQVWLTMLLQDESDEGQGTLEYVGMIAVAAILALAVLQVTDTVDLGGFFQTQIEKITNFGG